MEFILVLPCIRIHVERDAETTNRNRNSTESAAEKQRQKIQTAIQRKMQQCTYVMPGMLAKTSTANDLMFLPLRLRSPEVVEHDPDDDKTASLYIRIYAKPFTHTH